MLLVWGVALTSLLIKTRQSSGCDLIVLIYAEPQHKLLFRVVRGEGVIFELHFVSVNVCIYVSSGKFIFFGSAGVLSLALVNKN